MASQTKKVIVKRQDVEFCAQCGSLLPMPDPKHGYIVCGTCKHKWVSPEINDELQSISQYRYDRVAEVVEDEEDAGQSASAAGPTVNRKCAKCGNDTMSYATRQTRSADEGMTVFFTCTKCGHRDIEYT